MISVRCLAVSAVFGLGVALFHSLAVGAAIEFDRASITLCGQTAPSASASVCGFSVIARGTGPQIALMNNGREGIASVRRGEQLEIALPIRNLTGSVTVTVDVARRFGTHADPSLSLGEVATSERITTDKTVHLKMTGTGDGQPVLLRLVIATESNEAAVHWRNLRIVVGSRSYDPSIAVEIVGPAQIPPPVLPALRTPIENALIEWDWRMQDGIDTEREPRSYAAAVEQTLQRGDQLIHDRLAGGNLLDSDQAEWNALSREWHRLSRVEKESAQEWEDLWRRVHWLRRRIALSNPVARFGALLFVKRVPASFSHELTQYLGRYARPGGGIFVLEEPGRSMRCRQLAPESLPRGTFQQPELSYDATRVLFAYCRADTVPPKGLAGQPDRSFHLYEMTIDGQHLRQLTDGPFNDFSPRYLPNGQILFISTRRGGWHRCGGRPGQGCENYTLALAESDGSRPRTISFHETQEWDPSVLDDGRIIYTRWDYVDRHAVYYEQLWTARPDGSHAAIYYGNNTFNPVAIWEARQVPHSTKVVATAGAHHAMTAGSLILLDVTAGVDGSKAVTRLTPDALFPESETRVAPRGWHAPAGVSKPPIVPPEARRWPGHCYRTPFSLSENCFLAAYSFDPLIGEPDPNRPNMFGIYLVDRFGNKELLYRDPNISSLWPIPLRVRSQPVMVPPTVAATDQPKGTFFVQDVYESEPPLPKGMVKRLRILQVLPKSTPGINWPRMGLPNASPGKQVLGTVPVESDGSAHFRAPTGIPLSFQALDEYGQAIQIMRSVVYLQPGETVACTGCHEPRRNAPPPTKVALAALHPPSTIEPGPDGSKPFSYPVLVQPVLDTHCVRCHNKQQPDGDIVLTGEPAGQFTTSYNVLASRVTYAAWGGRSGDFRVVNSEPVSMPGHFGAKSSPVMKLLLDGHKDVVLSDEDIERLATWMDANALFYGTFNRADQARQLRGERIAGPDLQ